MVSKNPVCFIYYMLISGGFTSTCVQTIVKGGSSRLMLICYMSVICLVQTIENQRKTKKLLEERNGESDKRGDGSSSFIVKKTRISVQLQLLLDSLRTRVVSLEAWILQIMVWSIIT